MMMHEPQQFTALRGTLARDVPLARYTSWRCGGAGDRVYLPADRDDLAAFIRQVPPVEPVTVIGLGSNLLVRDGGIRGTVIVMHAALNVLEVRDRLIYAESGVASPKVARFAAAQGLAGAEFFAGIPGTIGGALAMNAGCYGGETWQFVARVEVVTRSGNVEERLPSAYTIGYRSVLLADGRAPDDIFSAAWLAFPGGDGRAARERIAELLRRRNATQPLNLPNAGSVFRNPSGDHAARLIETCGLKGYAVGSAQVSEKHANFIVNPKGRARASDIEAIIAHVQRTVREMTGVDLEPEVRVIGEAAKGARS